MCEAELTILPRCKVDRFTERSDVDQRRKSSNSDRVACCGAQKTDQYTITHG